MAAVKTPAKPMTEGETVANGESEPANPECAEKRIWPCSAECWHPCNRCHKLVCERHDYLVPVLQPDYSACGRADTICKECIAELWYRGDLSQTSQSGSRTEQ